jgi:parvulin-like peptidyl-prolyl isomerase
MTARVLALQSLPAGPRRRRGSLRSGAVGLTLLAACFGPGCDACSGAEETPALDVPRAGGLTSEQAQIVLARVGDRTITLGDYAAALERMDPLERIRYQTADRRQALLDEMINVELLAREAERRGLDRRPETIALVRELQRDELLRRLRATLPNPADLTSAEVSEYYRAHHAEFSEPERRRAAHIELGAEAQARRVIAEARGASAERWRELVLRYDPSAGGGDKTAARPPLEVPGDLGMLEASGSAAVPLPLVRAAFQIPAVGEVFPEPVEHAGKFHVVRLVSKIEARQRTLVEVDDAIRARIIAERQAAARAALLRRLRETIKVSVDESVLGQIPPPSPSAAAAAQPQ